MNRPPRIGLLGPYASANLGDTSVQVAVMDTLKERLGPVRFLGISTNPADVARTHGISAIALSGEQPRIDPVGADGPETGMASGDEGNGGSGFSPWLPRRLDSLRRIHRTTASLDLLIISGSGQIDDFWGGAWGHPFRMLAWSASARRQRVPVAVLGVGVDELHTRLGAWFSIRALHFAQFRAFRDKGSLDRLLGLGLKAPSMVCPDPAFGLKPPAPLPGSGSRPPYAIVSPIARDAWPGAEDGVYENYLHTLAKVSEHLLEKGLDLRFACSQTRMDVPIVERIKKKMTAAAAGKCLLEPIVSVEDYLRAAGPAEVVIASRLHAAILAFVAGAPVITLADTRKVRVLMQDMQLQEFSLDLRAAGPEAALAAIDAALSRRENIRKHIAGLQGRLRSDLASTYDQLLASVFPKKSQ
ncbi:MAG: hypothetical protein JWO30_1035 [Fibrobacteres bacterium]|nr:hypothetical protein [Fibrobacterota bacterium]